MTSMREKIARAIYEKRNGAGVRPWSTQPGTHRLPYLMDADAALDALMEPTEGMGDAGEEITINCVPSDIPDASILFRAMTLAAKEGK